MAVRRVKRSERNALWIEAYCRIPEGKYVGNPVKLTKHQREWLADIYDTPTRRFILSVGRKNAKTTFSAFLLLLHTCGPEAIANSQLYSAAQSREQAAILFALAAKTVRGSPDLIQHISIRDTAKQLFCPDLGTLYRALSAEASTAHGLSPIFTVHDELGQVRGSRSELYEALETASAGQEHPLSVIISTQAPTDADLLSVLIDDAKTGADPRTKVRIYSADNTCDPFSDEAIKQANPHFDIFMNQQEVRDQALSAKRMPSAENSYRNLILNQRVNLINPFISRDVWENGSAAVDDAVFKANPVYGGLDLSTRNDLTALVFVARDAKNIWHTKCFFFAPLNGIADRSRRDRTPYDLWAKQGWIIATPGSTVDYEVVAQKLCEFADEYNIATIAFDRYRIKELESALSRLNRAMPLSEFGQGFVSMGPALDATEAELLNGRVRHGGNPVLRMCAANAVVVKNPVGDRKLDKSKATGRIDGMVALVMALGVAATQAPKAKKEYKLHFV